jgi:putative ABC transport system permease protein
MFIEMGFLNGLYDSQTQVVKLIDADLMIVNAHKEAVVPKLPFPRKRLTQAKGHQDVAGAYPLYIEEFRALWKNEKDNKDYPILVYAFDPDDPIWLIPEVKAQAHLLKIADSALLDSSGKKFFGENRADVRAELARKKVRVVGTFPLGPDFRADGNVFLSDKTFFKCFAEGYRSGGLTDLPVTSKVDFGIVKVRSGADVKAVQQDLTRMLPSDVIVLTKDEFIGQVKRYWGESKPVGYVFGMGTIVGFMIGVTICYQILFTDISDNLPQYATLKAMGYANSFLVRVVIQQALILAVFGFFPGLLVSLGIYALLQKISGILMLLTPERAAMVFVLTVVMCLVSAGIAIRKVINSDPAELF